MLSNHLEAGSDKASHDAGAAMHVCFIDVLDSLPTQQKRDAGDVSVYFTCPHMCFKLLTDNRTGGHRQQSQQYGTGQHTMLPLQAGSLGPSDSGSGIAHIMHVSEPTVLAHLCCIVHD